MKIQDLLGQNKAMFTDHAYITSFSTQNSKNGSQYGTGVLLAMNKEKYPFKIWDTNLTEVLKEQFNTSSKAESPVILKLSGETNIYNGSFGVIITHLQDPDEGFTIYDFLKSDYTVDNLMTRFTKVYKGNVSPDGVNIVAHILQGQLANEFVTATSALNHHDSQVHGLLAHTTKMMEIANIVVQNYPSLFNNQDTIDLFVIGLLLHDIGKTQEYSAMSASKRAFLGHRYLGALLLEQHRELIESKYGEVGCDHLISVLLQHHGQYEERPKTVLAYAVHLVDVFEARMTSLNESMTVALKNEDREFFVRESPSENYRLAIYYPDTESE